VGHHADYSDVHWQPLFRHWNGKSWKAFPAPPRRGRFYAVAAVSRTNAWAVGEGPIIAHWNGVSWRLVPSPQVTKDFRQPARLLSVAAVSATDIWAVGLNWHYPALQLIEHWNGRQWRVILGAATGQHPLNGVAALSATDIWAVGVAGHTVPHDGYAEHPFVEHWNGLNWSIGPTPATGSPDSQLLAVTAVPPRTIWAVGFAGRHRAGKVHSLIERYVRC
jgi:hypothetical protein